MISLRCIYSAELEYVSGWMDSVFLGGEGEVEDLYICVYVYTAPEHCLVSIYIYIFSTKIKEGGGGGGKGSHISVCIPIISLLFKLNSTVNSSSSSSSLFPSLWDIIFPKLEILSVRGGGGSHLTSHISPKLPFASYIPCLRGGHIFLCV